MDLLVIGAFSILLGVFFILGRKMINSYYLNNVKKVYGEDNWFASGQDAAGKTVVSIIGIILITLGVIAFIFGLVAVTTGGWV